jgi:hypothetical protein
MLDAIPDSHSTRSDDPFTTSIHGKALSLITKPSEGMNNMIRIQIALEPGVVNQQHSLGRKRRTKTNCHSESIGATTMNVRNHLGTTILTLNNLSVMGVKLATILITNNSLTHFFNLP